MYKKVLAIFSLMLVSEAYGSALVDSDVPIEDGIRNRFGKPASTYVYASSTDPLEDLKQSLKPHESDYVNHCTTTDKPFNLDIYNFMRRHIRKGSVGKGILKVKCAKNFGVDFYETSEEVFGTVYNYLDDTGFIQKYRARAERKTR